MIGEYSAIVNLQSSNLGRELRADNTLWRGGYREVNVVKRCYQISNALSARERGVLGRSVSATL